MRSGRRPRRRARRCTIERWERFVVGRPNRRASFQAPQSQRAPSRRHFRRKFRVRVVLFRHVFPTARGVYFSVGGSVMEGASRDECAPHSKSRGASPAPQMPRNAINLIIWAEQLVICVCTEANLLRSERRSARGCRKMLLMHSALRMGPARVHWSSRPSFPHRRPGLQPATAQTGTSFNIIDAGALQSFFRMHRAPCE